MEGKPRTHGDLCTHPTGQLSPCLCWAAAYCIVYIVYSLYHLDLMLLQLLAEGLCGYLPPSLTAHTPRICFLVVKGYFLCTDVIPLVQHLPETVVGPGDMVTGPRAPLWCAAQGSAVARAPWCQQLVEVPGLCGTLTPSYSRYTIHLFGHVVSGSGDRCMVTTSLDSGMK